MLLAFFSWKESITRQILAFVEPTSEVLTSASIMACVDNDRRAVHIGQGCEGAQLRLPPFSTRCTIWAPLPRCCSLLINILALQREILLQSSLCGCFILALIISFLSKWVLEVRIEGGILSLKLFELALELLCPLIIAIGSLKCC